MKKLIISAVILFTLALGLSSCGSSEKCPAYSQIEQQDNIPS